MGPETESIIWANNIETGRHPQESHQGIASQAWAQQHFKTRVTGMTCQLVKRQIHSRQVHQATQPCRDLACKIKHTAITAKLLGTNTMRVTTERQQDVVESIKNTISYCGARSRNKNIKSNPTGYQHTLYKLRSPPMPWRDRGQSLGAVPILTSDVIAPTNPHPTIDGHPNSLKSSCSSVHPARCGATTAPSFLPPMRSTFLQLPLAKRWKHTVSCCLLPPPP